MTILQRIEGQDHRSKSRSWVGLTSIEGSFSSVLL